MKNKPVGLAAALVAMFGTPRLRRPKWPRRVAARFVGSGSGEIGAGRPLYGPAPSSAQGLLVPHVAAAEVQEREHERQDRDDGGDIGPRGRGG